MALFTVSPVYMSRNVIYLLETRKLRRSLFVTMLSSVYLVYLDIIIDPVALRGSRWFLGQIYGYPEAGAYFGVTIANFAGWAVVGFILTYLLQSIDYILSRKVIADRNGHKFAWRYLIGPALYAGILVFNIFMTFLIGEDNIGWVGLFIIIIPVFSCLDNNKGQNVICRVKRLNSRTSQGFSGGGNLHYREKPVRVAILAALPQELGPLIERLRAIREERNRLFDIYFATDRSTEIILNFHLF